MPTLVKICGITRVEDAVAAARFGADFVGLNFYPGSPRCISEGQARLIMQALPANVTPVALFVNEAWEDIRERAERLGIKTVQVHGDKVEQPPFASLEWILTTSVKDQSSLADFARQVLSSLSHGEGTVFPRAVLFDAHVPGTYGGTGQTAPWNLVLRSRWDGRIILAGGLTPDNVAEAIRIVHPWAVDVASGVESAPGIKDHDKMRRFIDAAKSVNV